ncbi:MAG: hypothetical protein WCK11_01855 [Candidatus Falkowbacteria bacterium]
MNENNNKTKDAEINLADKVLGRISASKIAIKPHWQFVLEKVSLETVLLLILGVVVLLFILVAHYWLENRLHQVLLFGMPGVWHVLIHFPYELVVLAGFGVLSLLVLVRKFDWGYKRTWLTWLGGVVGLSLLFAGAGIVFGLRNQVEQMIKISAPPVYNNWLFERLHNIGQETVHGRIDTIDLNGMEVIIEDEATTATRIMKLQQRELLFKQLKPLHSGDRIRIFGNKPKEQFLPWGVELEQ